MAHPPITEEQKEEFLERLAQGELRHEAAQAVGVTATKFKHLAGRDPKFARRLDEILEKRGDLPAHPGHRNDYWEPTPEQETEFLDYIREGFLRPEAAQKMEMTGSRWRSYTKRNRDFAFRYDEASVESDEAFIERLRQVIRSRAIEGGSDQILISLGKALLPELRVLLSHRVELANPEGEALRILAGQAEGLSDDELRALIARLEKLEGTHLKELPPAEDEAA